MTRNILIMSILASSLVSIGAPASESSSYTGQEEREIKALSASEISGLLTGEGMGYAMAAELNGYPGPAHVLELAEELELTAEQRAQTEGLFAEVKASARELGAELVAAERRLDEMFRDKTVDESSMADAVTRIGQIDSRLRAAHLRAHLRQIEVLSERQVTKYMMLRGYKNGGDRGHHQHHHGG
jgi:Spy/CpxP family protein refolding chaperone